MMGEEAVFVGFRHGLVVLGPKPGYAPRQCALALAKIAGLDEAEALAILNAAPIRLYRDMPLAEAAVWQMRLEHAGIGASVQAEPIRRGEAEPYAAAEAPEADEEALTPTPP